ncbi:hypothetical protein BT63DRAFT_78105 [Microthyrium microscopicum]|uniref:Uncharacterized protein n=1 Tax=Microthyrium microscopicum TaxID=703497 RepID=A0A6A6U1N3_9PEZI|nr:hypothetical protein BT63DRAFT_78105 [Microthyrium microscopicum]
MSDSFHVTLGVPPRQSEFVCYDKTIPNSPVVEQVKFFSIFILAYAWTLYSAFRSLKYLLRWLWCSECDLPPHNRPIATITGVRIPANGSSPHLITLKTMTPKDCDRARDEFLLHVPDLRQFWITTKAWRSRDMKRLDLLRDVNIGNGHREQQQDLVRQLLGGSEQCCVKRTRKTMQRHTCPQEYHIPQRHYSDLIMGTYYLLHSMGDDGSLHRNQSVPNWLGPNYSGDVFIVKMAKEAQNEYGWAVYENMSTEFLSFLSEGPVKVAA